MPAWYAQGLRFSCTGCGECCRGAPGYVWLRPGEVPRMADFLGVAEDEFRQRFTRAAGERVSLVERRNGDCILWSEEEGCRVYPLRPAQCRTFPFWSSNVADPASWERVASACPGAGRGRLYSREEINRLARGEGQTGNG